MSDEEVLELIIKLQYCGEAVTPCSSNLPS